MILQALKMGPDTFSDFSLEGFYENEGGFRWTMETQALDLLEIIGSKTQSLLN